MPLACCNLCRTREFLNQLCRFQLTVWVFSFYIFPLKKTICGHLPPVTMGATMAHCWDCRCGGLQYINHVDPKPAVDLPVLAQKRPILQVVSLVVKIHSTSSSSNHYTLGYVAACESILLLAVSVPPSYRKPIVPRGSIVPSKSRDCFK